MYASELKCFNLAPSILTQANGFLYQNCNNILCYLIILKHPIDVGYKLKFTTRFCRIVNVAKIAG